MNTEDQEEKPKTQEDQEEKPKTKCFSWINKHITSVLACVGIIAVVLLLILVSVLTWAYVRNYQDNTDLEQLREPTGQQQLFTTSSLKKKHKHIKKLAMKKTHIVDDSDDPHILRSSIPINNKNGMQLFVVHAGLSTGGVCLDGSPPAYYYRPGKDLGLNRWLIHFNGGAWCFDEGACVERSKSSLGSTKHLPASPPIIEGINSPDPQVNPDFYDWNLVWVVYCDGASFTGNREEPATVDGQLIYFRGKKILDVIFNDLISKGMRHAERVILTGSSAGSMTAMFAIDYLASMLPNIPVHALSDAGFFIETAGMGGKSVGAIFKKIYDFQNSSSGLNQDCVQAFGPLHAWQCFLPEHTFKFIKQPVFVLNAAYDVWALIYFVGINCKFPTQSTSDPKKVIGNVSNKAKRAIGNVIPDISDSKNLSEKGDIVLKHRRDISGFEILPFFRSSSEDRNTLPFYTSIPRNKSITSIESSKDIQVNNLRHSEITTNRLKAKIESSKQKTRSHNNKSKTSKPTKRGIVPEHTDIVDTLNSYSPSTDDTLDTLGNSPEITVMNETPNYPYTEEPIALHSPTSPTGSPDTSISNNEDLDISEIQTVNGIPIASPSDQKEDSMSMTPLASSVSESSNTVTESADVATDDMKKEKLDPAALGLLAEVFGKLTRLLPTKPNLGLKNISIFNIAANNTGSDGSGGLIPQKAKTKVINSNSLKIININKDVHPINLVKGKNWPKPALLSPQAQKLVDLKKFKSQKVNSVISNKSPLHILNLTKPKLLHINNVVSKIIPVSKSLHITHITNINKAPSLLKPLHFNTNMNKALAVAKTKAKHNQRNVTISLHRSNINNKAVGRTTSLAKEYINILRADPPECTDGQMVEIMKYRDSMMSATQSVRRKQNAGMFLVSCLDHSLSLFDETWTSIFVNGKTIAQAFGDWYYARQTQHLDLDCPYPCNPSCP